jgi:CRP-like cAMP-binding protein
MLAQAYERNAFLARLAAEEFALLHSHLAAVDLRVGQFVHGRGDQIDHVIFPLSALLAMTVPAREKGGVGVALVGQEGVVGGLAAAASAPATCDAEVHIGGQALRLSASIFRDVLDQSQSIRRHAARFDHAIMAQAQQAALCHAAHSVEARICRWLLEVEGRSGNSKVSLTQATLAQLLGVRRTTVTLVAGQLEAVAAIKCRRGYIQIISREQLERASCECYKHARAFVTELITRNENTPSHSGFLSGLADCR